MPWKLFSHKALPLVGLVALGAPLGATAADLVCLHTTSSCAYLNRLYRQGKAAGNHQDYYDNRDRGHSQLKIEDFPQVKAVEYTEEQRNTGQDWGGQIRLLPKVVVGNSSTSAPPQNGGCQARLLYYSQPQKAAFLYSQYRTNNLYVYPEHRDHDPGHNGGGGFGDLLPLNTPYLVLSQGSSGSDKPFLRAFFYTLAAFRPQVKERLRQTGLLMPTLQMILRRTGAQVDSDAAYLSGAAHPSAFKSSDLRPLQMATMAQALDLDKIPPMVQLAVLEEDEAKLGLDYFENGLSEPLADTPAAIGRVYRRIAGKWHLKVSAAESFDINNQPLSYHWVLLRGDPKQVTIEPYDGGAAAAITVGYQPRQAVAPGKAMASNRVDIGVFVHNGYYYSAPGFISFYSLDSEKRFYDPKGRPREIVYSAGPESPMLPGAQSPRWGDLLARFSGEEHQLGVFLLERQLTPAQSQTLRRCAATLARPVAHVRQLQKQLKVQEAELKTANQEKKRHQSAAGAQGQHKDSLKGKAKLAAQKIKQKEIEWRIKGYRLEIRKIRQEIRQVGENIALQLVLEDPGSGLSALEIVETALGELAQELDLYPTHAPVLESMLSDGARAAFESARQRLQTYGLLVDDGQGKYRYAQPVAAMDSISAYHIKQFNLVLLSRVLFPYFLQPHPRNFVDARLGAQKNWRDVYHYDGDRWLGWTRYDQGKVWEFDALGHVGRRRAADGRVPQTAPVRYFIGPKNRLKMKVMP